MKYIDSVEIESFKNVFEYIRRNLQTDISSQFEFPGLPSGLNINQSFEVNGSSIVISIQTAINNLTGKKALVWTTTVEKSASFNTEDIFTWLDYAHGLTSELFVKMLNPEFYASFNPPCRQAIF